MTGPVAPFGFKVVRAKPRNFDHYWCHVRNKWILATCSHYSEERWVLVVCVNAPPKPCVDVFMRAWQQSHQDQQQAAPDVSIFDFVADKQLQFETALKAVGIII
jgi:hypothetical protein